MMKIQNIWDDETLFKLSDYSIFQAESSIVLAFFAEMQAISCLIAAVQN